MKVLITGFDPFGGEKINPAWEAVKGIKDIIEGAKIIKLEIPTVFNKSIEKVKEAMELEKPDIVLCIGQAGGRYDMTVERVAINVDDARIEDNEGNQPIDIPVFEDGENAYFSNLPIKAMVEEIKGQGIPSSISNSAGTFVCNHIMYGVLYHINKTYKNMRGGFIHVPFINEQVLDKKNQPYMPVEHITKALEAAIKAAVINNEDIKKSGGAIC
ncbi:Pyrrolidone-carboxylate peptidase (5-oxoprolyl-peptidase) (Pyroglutamyl-peptidase I) (PGP-I) (Pyrase) [Acetoanaerobium sticklandii]|uniref:Pyrrolidone-carboxylate peptidase n=1 Tax=Acetoanaerobium sticklandii (strain ATCC 12662 / DSM 519 / JCM 1433 / CCUG 9281 / NCIMB 10654 / HF) TaxID=499177 RepID=E3PR53_ACESD|nr:pyroglutamyl-peptidase I [Acetoanaerobium sticklandii]CBH20250.1 Pyrrolidone-carboxylate peptidase (5-oxoprolyl-peptidase) (Pyroglutamyl-peptidase I) (PGP-I) (Pyrase) [Acetoanaerobium sticklandii]